MYIVLYRAYHQYTIGRNIYAFTKVFGHEMWIWSIYDRLNTKARRD